MLDLSYLPLSLAALLLATMPGILAGPEGVEWRDAASLTLEGRGWEGTESPYDRLPARAWSAVPPGVRDLSRHSAGLCVRFRTDAPRIEVRWSLSGGSLAMPHMPATGVSGVDLYVRPPRGGWRFVQNGRPESAGENAAAFAVEQDGTRLQEYLLYLPLYNGVRRLEIGVPAGRRLEAAGPRPPGRARPMVVYGTSIVQGGCASRPGLAWPAILGRSLDRPVINLGFSGSGRMEPALADLLAELDPAVYVIDCLWNMGDLNEAALMERVQTLARTIRRARPETPILFVGQSSLRPEAPPTPATAAQEKAVRALQAEGVGRLYLVAGRDLLGSDGEGTVDGVHPNDLGMLRHAEALRPVLERILSDSAHERAGRPVRSDP